MTGILCERRVINPRKLAAIDIVFLGPKFVIVEFAGAVLLCPSLGAFVLFRGQSLWQLVLGVYLILLGINVPMLFYAVALSRREAALKEMGNELVDKRPAMAKYRLQSLALLIPLLVPAVALVRKRRSNRADKVAMG